MYIQNDWVQGPSLLGSRLSSAAVELANGTFWIMSGLDEEDRFTSEMYQDGEFTLGPALPQEGFNSNPCAARITDTLTFYGNNRAFIHNTETGQFQETGRPIFPAYKSACGAARRPDGSRIVVVAGGQLDTDFLDRVQILDVATGRWTEAPVRLPYPLVYARTVALRDSFVIAGGTNFDDYQSSLFQFDPVDYSWITLDERLSQARRSFFLIDVAYDKYCSKTGEV